MLLATWADNTSQTDVNCADMDSYMRSMDEGDFVELLTAKFFSAGN